MKLALPTGHQDSSIECLEVGTIGKLSMMTFSLKRASQEFLSSTRGETLTISVRA